MCTYIQGSGICELQAFVSHLTKINSEKLRLKKNEKSENIYFWLGHGVLDTVRLVGEETF